jgi:lipopolysaccharide export LptBFGC system permease protein LptF
MIKRPNSSIAMSVSVTILVIIGAFIVIASGLSLGPHSKKRESTSISATLAAEEFVRQAVEKRADHIEGQEFRIVFSKQDSQAKRDLDNINRWIVSGKARSGTANLEWSVWEQWDGEHEWKLQAIQVIGPKK